MNYPLSERNWICRLLGHRYGPMYEAGGMVRQTCCLDGKTIPPFDTPADRPWDDGS